MLKNLKRSFVLLSTGLTGLVLFAACLLAFFLTKNQMESTSREAFEYQSQTLSVLLAGTNQLDHSQIYRMETDGNVYIYLFDNGNPIRIESRASAEERDGLYGAALSSLENSNASIGLVPDIRNLKPVNASASFTRNGQNYYAKYLLTPTGTRQWYSIVLIKPITEQSDRVFRTGLLYTGIFVGGLVVLLVISWMLAKRSVKPVEDAQEKQKEFIAAASHELKSPLAVITSSADVMESAGGDMQKGLHTIKSEAKRMSSLVEDMLLLAGAETGKWTIKKSQTNIEDTLANVYERYLPLAKMKDVSLQLVLPEDTLSVVFVDEERIIQVLSILLSNAISYSPAGSEIVIRGKEDKNGLALTVQDNGRGISCQDKEHVFDSFYRAQRSHSDKSHFGLGLAVAKELVTLHNGKITVVDTPGGGATFTVVIPKEQAGS